MPSKEQMKLVGQTCSEYERESEEAERSCESCRHWITVLYTLSLNFKS